MGGIALAIALAPACGSSAQPDAGSQVDAAPPAGTISLSWKLTDGPASIACSDVGGRTVTLKLVPVDGFFGASQPFTCSDGKGTTDSIVPGSYNATIELVSSAGDLADPIKMSGVEVKDGQNTDLGQVNFDVPRQGGISFSLSAAGGPNCKAAGAGIDQFTFELVKGGTCVPATFTIPAGQSQGGGTYAADCNGASTGCIETDQTVSVTTVASGTYHLDITGTGAGSGGACWTRVSQFTVPGGNLVDDLGELDLQPCASDGGVPDGGMTDGAPGD